MKDLKLQNESTMKWKQNHKVTRFVCMRLFKD